ncbi:MAG TPA: class I SAM-dependent methyltransferase [Rhizomicrobium sp.]|nr:class I SAM-dependent methyltransferase [Rhizomicrobium sp.]
MDAAEFDKFADEYRAAHAKNLHCTGEDPEYFSRYKIEIIRKRWTRESRREPKTILDFGAGVGNSIPFLSESFPAAELTALDVSRRSLEIAQRRNPGVAKFVLHSGESHFGLTPGAFDLIFTSCVFHHIPANEHTGLFAQLRSLLAPDGVMVTFEHNPNNPVTRYIVATCPFDENAILISARKLVERQRRAGFSRIDISYTGFFPGSLRRFRPLERYMTSIPIGAQYYSFAHD